MAAAGNGAKCQETETYTFTNAVLHRTDDGKIEVYHFPGVHLDDAEADADLLAHASRVLNNEQIESLYTSGGPNKLFTIPIPFVDDKDGGDVPVSYQITGEKHNQLTLSFSATTDQYPLILDPTLK